MTAELDLVDVADSSDPRVGRGWDLINGGDAMRAQWLEQVLKPRPCRVCGGKIRANERTEEREPLLVCGDCGGRKKQEQLGLREELPEPPPPVLEAPPPPPPKLVAHFEPFEQPPEESPMSEKLCSRGCGRKLRSNNTRGFCGYNCAGKPASGTKAVRREPPAAREVRAPEPVRSSAATTTPADVETRFAIVAEVLGFDRDELLRELMAWWLESLKATAGHAKEEP